MNFFKLTSVVIIVSFSLLGLIDVGVKAVKAENFVVNSTKEIKIRDLYFPGEKVLIEANFNPKKAYILSPSGEKIDISFKKSDEFFIAEFELKKNVVLGKYKVFVDEIERSFLVDFCDLKAEYYDGILKIEAKTYFVEPKIEFLVNSEKGEGIGKKLIKLQKGSNKFFAKCGNSFIQDEIFVNFSLDYDGKIFAKLDGKFVNAKFKVFADKEYEFYGSFNPLDLNFTKFTVYAEYEHLNLTDSFDLGREVYFPGEKIVLKTFTKNVKVIDPINRVHEPTFKDGIAEFSLSKEVVLGEYRLLIENFERKFFVDSYRIEAFFENRTVKGKVFWYFFEPKFLEVIVGKDRFEFELKNGSFEFESPKRKVLIRCGNAEAFLEAEMKIEVKDYYFVGEEVKIFSNFKPDLAILNYKGVEVEIEFEEFENGYLAKFTAAEPGIYELEVDGLKRKIILDLCEIDVEIGEKTVGFVSCLYRKAEFVEVVREYGTEKLALEDGKFVLDGAVLKLKYGNAEVFVRNIEVKDLYLVGDIVEVKIDFLPKKAFLISPYGKFPLEFEDGVAKFKVDQSGIYEVFLDGLRKKFFVDSCKVEVDFEENVVKGKVVWKFKKPSFIYFKTKDAEGKAEVDTFGNFTIYLDNLEFLEIKCGNELKIFERKVNLNRTFFIGEKVEILANFKPKKSFLVFENKEIPFDFIEKNGSWVYEFVAENV
ncbi:MAG: hypothetical protein NZ895_05735, partial [Archaeoglobaceae archaeon]|nr:hypothetical protein [Archaeoglobaceae archaeon]